VQFKIKSQEDFWAGLMFIGFGLLAVVVARDYPFGSTMRMGPGYFPTVLGGLMIVMGAIISIRSTWVAGEGIRRFGWRGLFFLSLAFATYGFLIDTMDVGFVISIAAVVILSTLASREFNWVESLWLAALLVLGTVAVFIWGLDMPYPLFWWR
jgi:putative tricarboxylic transport membrane protein